MHKYFADWYRSANIEPKRDEINSRWKGIENFVANMNLQDIIEIIRLYYELQNKDKSFLDKYRKTFKDLDPTFPMKENALELQVLAGATIAQILNSKVSFKIGFTAYATACVSCKGLKKAIIADIEGIADTYLANESLRVRNISRPEIPTERLHIPNLPSNQPPIAFNQEGVTKLVMSISTIIATQHNSMVDTFTNIIEKQKEEIDILKEESNIAWWLYGEYSNDLKQPINLLKVSFACLVIAKELASLTQILPGPRSARAYLYKMLRSVEPNLSFKITIKQAINMAEKDWKLSVETKDYASIIDLCPIHLAIELSLSIDSKDEWVAPYEKLSGVKVEEEISPIDLALQFYQEAMLFKTFKNCQ